MSSDEKEFFVKSIIQWAKSGNLRKFPWRETSDVWHVALAEVLLARTPASRVLPVYCELIKKYPSPASVSAKDLPDLVEALKPLGLQEKKALQVKALAEALRLKKSKKALIEELKKVPGMGRYSYEAVLLFGFKVVRPIVDGNVGRIFSRYFGLRWKGKAVSDEKAWDLAYELVPKEVNEAIVYSYGLLDFGGEVCKKKPNCQMCPLRLRCKVFKDRY